MLATTGFEALEAHTRRRAVCIVCALRDKGTRSGMLQPRSLKRRQPRHRDPVFARDGWRCAVPACTSRRNLHDHHLLFRSRGGDHARDNRITVCAWHHLRGIHQGRVRAWGTAPDAVTWELGTRPGQPPLVTLQGDRYLEVSELMA